MNRKSSPVAIVLLAFILLFVACGANNEPTNQTETMGLTVVEENNTEETICTDPMLATVEVPYDSQLDDYWDETTTTENSTNETQPKDSKPQETEPIETKPEETKPEETKPEETKPEETKPEETGPEETEPQETQPMIDPMAQEFVAYLKKTPAEQQAFYETFASPDAFFAWYNSAKAAYDANQDYIDISGGNIDLGDLE